MITQLEALDLTGRRLWQVVNKSEPVWILVFGGVTE
jgi:hypothetical protein